MRPKSNKIPKKRTNTKRPSKSRFFASKKAKTDPQIKVYSPEFNKLQELWYSKLADNGFNDIEAPAKGPEYETLQLRTKSTYALGKAFNTETRHYYARLRCFLTFNKQFKDQFGEWISPQKRRACELAAEAVPYRDILKELKGMPGRKLNLFSLSQLVNHFINIATTWNKTSHNGLDFEPDL